jgi:hypothetical protein
MDEINFSMSAPMLKIDDSLRGRNAFRRTMKSIKLFKEIKMKSGVRKPLLRINSILTSKTYKRIEIFLKLCTHYGVAELVLNPLRLQGEVMDEVKNGNENIKNLILSNEAKSEIRKKLPIFYRKAEEMGVKLDINGIEEGYVPDGNMEKTRKRRERNFISSLCFEPFLTILIGPMGEIGCCCGFDYEHSSLNISGKSLKEIWKSEFFSNIREMMIDNSPIPGCFCCGFEKMSEQLRLEIKNSKNII